MADDRLDPLLGPDVDPATRARRRLSLGMADFHSSSKPYLLSPDASGPQDPDTCRICRGEATPDEPLFYPCKCSGSIKYVHQDCLMEWLSHSQKKHCELCKTPFRFTKLYSPTMPQTLPFYVFVSHIAKYLFGNILVWLRAALVVSVWLGWLPYLERSVWSFLFWISDEGLGASSFGGTSGTTYSSHDSSSILAFGGMSGFGSTVCPSSPLFVPTTTAAYVGAVVDPTQLSSAMRILYGNVTSISSMILRLLFGSVSSADKTTPSFFRNSSLGTDAFSASARPPTLLSEVGFLRNFTRHPVVNRTIISILEGQIITILVIICFILIILVRDYVVQQQPEINMRAAFAAENAAPPPPVPEPVPEPVRADVGPRAEDVEGLRGPDQSDGEEDMLLALDDDESDDESDTDEAEASGLHVPAREHRSAPGLLRRQSQHDSAREEAGPSQGPEAAVRQPSTSNNDGGSRGRNEEDAPDPSSAATPLAWGTPASRQQSDPPQDLSTVDRATVHEYLRVYREAGGDPDKILKIAREEHLEGRLQYWVRLTQQVSERNKQSDRDAAEGSASTGSAAASPVASSSVAGASSTQANYAPSNASGRLADWSWPEDLEEDYHTLQQPSLNGKGKGRADETAVQDNSLFVATPLRPRSNTDGPPLQNGINPLANNNWSFSELASSSTTAVDESRLSAGPAGEDAGSSSRSGTWSYPTPPSSSLPESASPVASGDGSVEAQGADGARPEPAAGSGDHEGPDDDMVRDRSIEWENLHDSNEFPARPAEADLPHGVHHQRHVGILEQLAEFMWHDVHDIDLGELPPFVAGQEGFADNDGMLQPLQLGDAGLDEEAVADDFERGREAVEAEIAAGLDAEAIEDAEDLEGVMELLGMRGPIAGLFQNAIFCAFLVSITIFLGIFLPYNFGRISVWVIANPMRPVRILFAVSKLLQDMAVAVFSIASAGTLCLLSAGAHLWERAIGWGFGSAYLASTGLTSWNMFTSAMVRVLDSFFVDPPIISAGEVRNFSAISHEALLDLKGHVASLFSTAADAVAFLLGGDYSSKRTETLAFIANVASAAWHGMKGVPSLLSNPGSWVINLNSFDSASSVNPELAYWDGMDRFWAIMVGYVALCLIAAMYLRRGTPFSRGQTGQEWEASIIDGLNQASGVMKVILIIGIEMLIFPLYCGLLLDVALLPLFEDTTLKSRVYFTLSYPLTSIFVHWFVGTGYMFHFALFVSMCRKIMRKGVLYFIRDPDDPEFHPVRDVLERNVTTQLRKILFSAFVYGALVIICLGGVVWGLAVVVPNVLPIHYSSNEPVLEFPIDLLFYNFLMPLAVRFFKPSDGLHAMYTWWFRKCARALRITWFLFGERRVDEEGILALCPGSPYEKLPWWRTIFLEYTRHGEVIPKTWNDTFEGGTAKPTSNMPTDEMIILNVRKRELVRSKQLLPNGRFVRTPASDQVKIPKGKKVFLEVTEANTRLDGLPDRGEADLYATDQYQFVYVPPHFRLRIFLFIMFIWIFAAVTGVGITIVPLVFGRHMFKLLIPAHIRTNDIYAFTIGIYILGSLAYFIFHARWIYRELSDAARRTVAAVSNHDAVRSATALCLRGGKLLYAYFFLLVVFPLLASSLVELYLLIPLHTYMYPAVLQSAPPSLPAASPPGLEDSRHTVRVIQTWTLGLLYLKLAARTITSWYEYTRLAAAVRAVLRRGWLAPEVGILTRAFIIPSLVLGFVAIAGPLLAARTLIAFSGDAGALDPLEVTLVYRSSFPIAALVAGLLWMLWGMVDVFRSWKVRIRDEAYLISERLHNFEAGNHPRGRRAGWRAGATRI